MFERSFARRTSCIGVTGTFLCRNAYACTYARKLPVRKASTKPSTVRTTAKCIAAHALSAQKRTEAVAEVLRSPVPPTVIEWGMLLVAYIASVRGSLVWQCAVFLSMEVVYAVLHIKPLLPILQKEGKVDPDVSYMRCFTVPLFFASEVALFALLALCSPLRFLVPVPVFIVHGVFHVAYTLLSYFAKEWSVKQNNTRIQLAKEWSTWGGLWALLLNVLNFGDFALHAMYTALFAAIMVQRGASSFPALAGPLVIGLAMYYMLGEHLPKRLYPPMQPVRQSKPRVPAEHGQQGESSSAEEKNGLEGRCVLITGGSSGIGLEAARKLAAKHAKVVIAARSLERSEAACAEIRRSVPGADVSTMRLDLGNFASVCSFASEFQARHGSPDVLINNAGVSHWWPYAATPEGLDLDFATNHLGHFSLTQTLLPGMEMAARESGREARIIVLTSTAYNWCYRDGIQFDALRQRRRPPGYTPWGSYGQSKLANLLYARELGRRLQASDSPVSVVALHPGVARTGLQRHMGVLGALLSASESMLGLTAEQAAQNVVNAALMRCGAEGGMNFVYMDRSEPGRILVRKGWDEQALLLWQLSEELTGLADKVSRPIAESGTAAVVG